jgi:hypothetical protein
MAAFTDSDWDSAADASAGPGRAWAGWSARFAIFAAGVVVGGAGASAWWVTRDSAAGVAMVQPPASAVSASRPAAEVATTQPPSSAASAASEPSPVPVATAPAASAETAAKPAVAGVPFALPSSAALDAAARRKEQAWRRYYQRPGICAEDRRGEFIVECANHSIRARRDFEALYAKGQL